jgi:hypothetical protein
MAQIRAGSMNQDSGTAAEQESSSGDATAVQLDDEACKPLSTYITGIQSIWNRLFCTDK